MLRALYNKIKTLLSRCFRSNAVAAPPPPEPAANPQESTAEVIAELDRNVGNNIGHEETKPWYHCEPKEAMELMGYGAQDFTWAMLSSASVNYKFQHTDNFWEATAAQQLWTSVFVLMWAPVNAYVWSKFYGANYKSMLVNAVVTSAGALSTIVPWDYFVTLGKTFFMNRGYDEKAALYLASVFPGPGMPEGIIQNVLTTGLSYLFDPNFKFNSVSFGIGLSPLNYLSGNAWLTVFVALSDIGKKNAGGMIGQAALVMSTAMLINYLCMKATTAVGNHCARKEVIRPRHSMNFFALPRHYEANREAPLPEVRPAV